MKNVMFLLFVCLTIGACSKEEQAINTTLNSHSRSKLPDVVYHYKGKEYPLYKKEGGKDEIVQDEKYKELEQIVGSVSGLAAFTFSNKPDNHEYLFDSEFDAYDYVEKNGHPIIGRKFKHAYRIDELRDRLIKKYGEDIDYSNPAIYAEALAGIEAIHLELKINGDLPRDVESYIGKMVLAENTQRTGVLLDLYEHINMGGYVFDIMDGTNTVTWTHGAYNCYRTTANPYLAYEYKPNSTNWNDCISSFCAYYQEGADAVCYGMYKDPDYAKYTCSRYRLVIQEGENLLEHCVSSLPNTYWENSIFCGTMNDQISSIRIKVAWQGCPMDWNDL